MKKTISRIIIVMLIVIFINGCSSSEQLPYINLADNNNSVLDNQQTPENAVIVGIASVISPQASRIGYDNMIKYLEEKLEAPIILVQGKTYAEINQMIKEGNIDIAFICSLAYVLGERGNYMDGIVAPKVEGKAIYRSYYLAHVDSEINKLDDLKGKRFAFTDPDSYSGRLAVLNFLKNNGETAESFFSKTFYTYSHDYSVKAVASGLVDGSAVDSLVFDQMVDLGLEDAKNIKIIGYSDWVGTPPVVVSKYVSSGFKRKAKNILLNMDNDPKGKEILKKLNIEEFVPVNNDSYKPIHEMIDNVGDKRWIN